MTGYLRMRRRARPACMALLMGMFAAQAIAEADSLPDMELLEFLVEWETSDGQWIDPVDLQEAEAQTAEEDAPEVPHD